MKLLIGLGLTLLLAGSTYAALPVTSPESYGKCRDGAEVARACITCNCTDLLRSTLTACKEHGGVASWSCDYF